MFAKYRGKIYGIIKSDKKIYTFCKDKADADFETQTDPYDGTKSYVKILKNFSEVVDMYDLDTEATIAVCGKEYRCWAAIPMQDYKKLPREEWGNIDTEVQCFFGDSGPDVPKKPFVKRVKSCFKDIKDSTIDGWRMVDRGTFRKVIKMKDFVRFRKEIIYLIKDGVSYKGNDYTRAIEVINEEITMEEYLRLEDEYDYRKI